MQPRVHVIVVTHNSENVIDACIAGVKEQGEGVATVTIVDSGSNDSSYLDEYEQDGIHVIRTSNIGFASANNLGFASLTTDRSDLIVFLNPDAFLQPGVISCFQDKFSRDPILGCATGKLLGYDLVTKKGSGRLDSSGIFRKWYGRWYDRGQGEVDNGSYDTEEYVPAICGALMCCSMMALSSFGDDIFDTSFFMYKEDIELSLRLRSSGWKLLYCPEVLTYHCRGWEAVRKDVSYEKKLLSATNEIKLYIKHPSVYMLWALTKYLLVRLFKV